MAEKFNDVNMVSSNSNAVLAESSDRPVSDLGSETISKDSSNDGNVSNGARVLEEPNDLVAEANRATRNRVAELMSCYDGPGFMGLMNLVNRVLKVDPVVDSNACRGSTSGVSDVEEIINAQDGVLTPNELVQFLETLAEAPHSETDESQVAMVKAQLLAFNRWKGRHQLPEHVEHVGLLEDDAQEATEGVIPGPCTRKHPSSDDERPEKKEKLMSVLLSRSSSRLHNGDK